jgi:Helix-turn-helix domain
VLDAIRACATGLLTRPSCHQYVAWRAGVLRAEPARRLPSHEVIRRRFGGYRQALAAAAISDEELTSARAESARLATAELASSPRARIGAIAEKPATEEPAAETGLAPQLIASLAADGCGDLLLPDAVAVARALGGSLDWLAERTPTLGKRPPASVRVDGERIRQQRREAGLTETEARARVRLPLGAWRRLLNGSHVPTLGELSELAGALGCSISDLVRCPE